MMPVIREARPDDLPNVLALYRHLSPEDPEIPIEEARPIWQQLLSSPTTMVIVAEIEGFVAATCVLIIVPNLTRGARPFAVIENVVTDSGYRNRGLGTALLRCAIDTAMAQRCYKVMLSTGRSEEATLRFYEKVGFKRGGKTFFEIRRM